MTLFDPSDAVASVGPTRRVRLTVAYDGSGFHGFAPNAGVRTVAGVLAEAIGRWAGHEVELTCAGRTDTGVHAWGQVVTVDIAAARLEGDDRLAALARSVNRMCGPEVAVRDLAVVDDAFDARFSALARRYRYRIWNHPEPDPFSARHAWHVDRPLERAALRLACDPLIGEHDFSTFCRKPKRRDVEPSLVRRVIDARWVEEGDGMLRFEIEASAFCHHMVRSIVGMMASIGLGRMSAGEVTGAIAARDRSRVGGDMAPPHGLTLWTVRYPGWSSVDD